MSLTRNKQEELDLCMAILSLTDMLAKLVANPEYIKNVIVDANSLNEAEQKKYDAAALVVEQGKVITDDANAKLAEAKELSDKARIQNEQNKNTADNLAQLRAEIEKNYQESYASKIQNEKLQKDVSDLKLEYEQKVKDANAMLAEASAKLEAANKYDYDIREKAKKIKLAADGL